LSGECSRPSTEHGSLQACGGAEERSVGHDAAEAFARKHGTVVALTLGVPRDERAQTRVERFRRGKIRPSLVRRSFTRFASLSSDWFGSHWAFSIAVGLVLVWTATGPLFNWGSDWQLFINTVTTVCTFVMVFLIQNTQTRDSKAIHLKLDELIRATPQARNEFMEAEEEDLDEILREKAIVDTADPAPPEQKPRLIEDGERTKERKAS
jgi:low affinity Fe/Cu permease